MDSQNWTKLGFNFSNGSSEAIKQFNISLNQLITWKEDDQIGGLDGSLSAMITADPNFLMGHILKNVITFLGTGTNPSVDPVFRSALDVCYNIASSCMSTSNNWENMHLTALKFLDEGERLKACQAWELILLTHPTDILALKLAHDHYFYLGLNYHIRNSVARVLSSWRPDMPYYGYVMGMYSFGLCETDEYKAAETYATMGLKINPKDAWSTHTLAHVYEMSGQYEKGSKFLEATRKDWLECNMLACHLHWHSALYSLSSGDVQRTLMLFDDHIWKRTGKSEAMLDIVDASSILYRLQLQGVNVEDRWSQLYTITNNHRGDHLLAFNDAHFLISFLGSRNMDTARLFISDLEEKTRTGTTENCRIMQKVGLPLIKSFMEHHNENHSSVVDSLWPIKEDVRLVGGSNAQRDMFNLLLIDSAKKSNISWHVNIARGLENERKEMYKNIQTALQ